MGCFPGVCCERAGEVGSLRGGGAVGSFGTKLHHLEVRKGFALFFL